MLIQAQTSIDILQGKWKVEGRESYEVWETEGDGLTGYAYKMVDGKQQIKETLRVELTDGVPVYRATVPNQNDGATIPFTQNLAEQEVLSFENPDHDFPVKVRYHQVNSDRLFVQVLGREGKGFSFYMDRVPF